MNERTNGDLRRVVSWAVYDAMSIAMDWSVNNAVNRAVNWAVGGTMDIAVDRAVSGAVRAVVYGAKQLDPEHSALQEFLYSCRIEVGTQ